MLIETIRSKRIKDVRIDLAQLSRPGSHEGSMRPISIAYRAPILPRGELHQDDVTDRTQFCRVGKNCTP
jgi:hypothetical protein